MRETWLLKVPVGSTADVDLPPGKLLTVTHACLHIPQGAKLAAGDPSALRHVDWVTLSVAKARPTSQGLPEFHSIAALSWPTEHNSEAASLATALQLSLDADVSFAASWSRLAGGSVGGGGALPGVAVHLSGHMEGQQ